MYEAFNEYVPRMATPEMTAELEQDMDEIAAGKTSKDDVARRQPRDAARDDRPAPGPKRGPREGDLGGDGRGQVPRPVQGLRGGRPQARGRLAEPAADHRHARRQAVRRLRGLETATTPSNPDSCDFTRPLPGRGYELWRLEERCSVCGEAPRLTVRASAAGPGSCASTTTARRWSRCARSAPSARGPRGRARRRRRTRRGGDKKRQPATTPRQDAKTETRPMRAPTTAARTAAAKTKRRQRGAGAASRRTWAGRAPSAPDRARADAPARV